MARLLETGRLAADLCRVVRRARRAYGGAYLPLARRGVRLLRDEGFEPGEALMLGLLDPDRPPGTHGYVSKRTAMEVQASLNPPGWAPLVQDKGMFYRHCLAAAIPIPRLLGMFFRSIPGWAPGAGELRGSAEWTAYFRNELPGEFVLKPSLGYHGRSVWILGRTAGGFVDPDGRSWTAEGLCRLLAGDPEFDAFVIQERIRNHPVLVGLSGTEYLQTVRVTTLVDSRARPRVLDGVLKVIAGSNPTDNHRRGRSGNLVARVDLRGGTLGPAAIARPDGTAVRWLERHPDTGVPFRAFRLPYWEEALRVCRRAAGAFQPIRTVGWDVALTPDGPVVLEGNNWWDPLNPVGGLDAVIAALRDEAQASGEGSGPAGGATGGQPAPLLQAVANANTEPAG